MPSKEPLSDKVINRIEAGIDEMSYTGGDVQRLINEIRRQRAVLDQVDSGAKRIEQGLDRVADQNAVLVEALNHLDTIIAAYNADGIMPLVNACRAAKEWRAAEIERQKKLQDQWRDRM
jgi:hypothetical protein